MVSHEHDADKECLEVHIPVPWGHLSGKWWGRRDIRPILGLHGWQDNAGTFDTLAPLITKHVGLLAIDFPGHGKSSRLPNGVFYHSFDNVHVILMIMREYNWEKVSLLAHSTGSIIGFLFAGLYPDKVEYLIGLDALKPHIRPICSVPKTISKRYVQFLIADERNISNKEPPSYVYDECVRKFHMGAFMSVDLDKCKYLLKRCIAESEKYPGTYYFTRDSRLKYYSYGTLTQEHCLEVAKRITSPYLFIKANSGPFFEEEKYFHETIEVLKNNPKFELVCVEGTHHVHLNSPSTVSGVINDFINRYSKPDNVLKHKL